MLAASLLAATAACTAPCMPLTDPGLGARHPGAAAMAARPRYPLASYVSNDDYPAAALRDRAQGRVDFALAIDVNGRVNGCRIIRSSGSGALDAATCRILRSRARYVPARNSRGVAVPDADVGEIGWTLPSG